MTDLRCAFRQLVKHPGFTTVAVLFVSATAGPVSLAEKGTTPLPAELRGKTYDDPLVQRRNDGTSESIFTAGNLVDDLFFFFEGDNAKTASLHVDEVVLFDAGRNE